MLRLYVQRQRTLGSVYNIDNAGLLYIILFVEAIPSIHLFLRHHFHFTQQPIRSAPLYHNLDSSYHMSA